MICGFIVIFLTFIPFSSAFSDSVKRAFENFSSFTMLGSGGRSFGNGSANLAQSDDCYGGSWNPAPLAILEQMQIAVDGQSTHRMENLNFGGSPDTNGFQTVSQFDMKFIGFAKPIKMFNHFMCVSVFYQKMVDLNRKWNISFLEQNNEKNINTIIDYQSEGDISSFSMAYALLLKDHFCFGLTLNFYHNSIAGSGWSQTTFIRDVGHISDVEHDSKEFIDQSYLLQDQYSFKGVNLNIGFLWKEVFQSNLNVAFLVKTPFNADLHFERRDSGYGRENTIIESENLTLKMPLSFGVGFAYKFSSFMIALDLYKKQWEDFVLIDESGKKTSPITGNPIETSPIPSTFNYQLGIGYYGMKANQYLFPIRCGLFYEESPAENSKDKYWGGSMGFGITPGSENFIRNHYSIDIAYQYRFGNNVNKSILSELNFSEDIQEHSLNVSFIYYFL